MISNKTIAILFLTIFNIQLTASSSPSNPQESNTSGESVPQARQRPASGAKKNVLKDTTNTMEDVLPISNQITTQISPWQRLVHWITESVAEKFERLIKQEKYEEIVKLGKKMKSDVFLKSVCPIVKSLEQYKGLVRYMKSCNLVASFYVHGDMEVVREAIIAESSVYAYKDYAYGGDLETALPRALKKDRHDRFIDLLSVRKGITIERDEQRRREGRPTSFEYFVYRIILRLVPWEDGMVLKRFLTFRGDELKGKHPDMLDTICQELVNCTKYRLPGPGAEKLLTDLIGQPLLLTSVAFAKGFLYSPNDESHSNIIKHGWREAIQASLKEKYQNGGQYLWRKMKEVRPNHCTGDYPDTEEALAAVLKHFPTKQDLEERWIKDYAPGFLEGIEQIFIHILPNVLVSIVIGYARPTWIDIETIKP